MGIEDGKKRIAIAYLEMGLDGREVVTCRQLLQRKMPPFINDQILLLARKHLKTQKPMSWNFNADIDFDDQDVKISFEKMVVALIKAVRMQREEVEACILTAVDQRIDLLVNPAKTLVRLFFSHSVEPNPVSMAKLLHKISDGYPLLDHLAETLGEIKEPSLQENEFRETIRSYLQKRVISHDDTEVIREFDLLLDLYTIDSTSLARGIEHKVVEEFFYSREHEPAVEVIRKKGKQGKTHWLREDMEDLFTFVLPQNGKTTLPIDRPKAKNQLPRIIFADDDMSTKIKRHKIEKQPPGPYPSLFSLLGKRDYKCIVRKLFQKDENAFIRFVNKIDNIEKWRLAKKVIDDELEERRLDPYCKEALKLGDVVFAKFFSRSNHYSQR